MRKIHFGLGSGRLRGFQVLDTPSQWLLTHSITSPPDGLIMHVLWFSALLSFHGYFILWSLAYVLWHRVDSFWTSCRILLRNLKLKLVNVPASLVKQVYKFSCLISGLNRSYALPSGKHLAVFSAYALNSSQLKEISDLT